MFLIESSYKKYRNLLPLFGSWASLFALLLRFRSPKDRFDVIHWILIILVVLCVVFTLYVEIRKQTKIHIIPEKNKAEINKYMLKWIKNSGRVAIFSRDMSFASGNKEIKDLLLCKSQAGEVIACVPKEIALTNELKEKTAGIYAYSNSKDFNPRTRFTIANYGQGKKERVAVAHGEDGFHVIQEFGKDDPVIYLTKDLIDIAIKLAERHA